MTPNRNIDKIVVSKSVEVNCHLAIFASCSTN